MPAPKRPRPLPKTLPDLVPYPLVMHIFRWKSLQSVRDAIAADKLVSVKVGNSNHDRKITAESVRTLHEEKIEFYATCKEFDKTPGQMKALAQAKKQRAAMPVPQINVVLDAREVIRQAHNLDKTIIPPFVPPPPPPPVAAPQSEVALYAAYHSARGAAKVAAYRNLTFKQKNAIIEAGRTPEPEFDLVAYRARRAQQGY